MTQYTNNRWRSNTERKKDDSSDDDDELITEEDLNVILDVIKNHELYRKLNDLLTKQLENTNELNKVVHELTSKVDLLLDTSKT